MRHIALITLLALFAASIGACSRSEAAEGARDQSLAREPIKKSQHGSVTQRVAQTEITVAYNRPVARGRVIFGEVVPWGRVWCPCADSATTISFSTDVTVDGKPVRAGSYSVWTIPDSTRWTLILSSESRAFHTRYPGHDALRVSVVPKRGDHMETLTFGFPLVDADSAILRLHWATTMIEVGIKAP